MAELETLLLLFFVRWTVETESNAHISLSGAGAGANTWLSPN